MIEPKEKKKTRKLQTVTAKEVMERGMLPTKFIVEGLIPQGLHILSGFPKVGKSWLLLQLSIAVAKGEQFWNYKTTQGSVLFLCLEDNQNRVYERLSTYLENEEDTPENLFLAIESDVLDYGLVEQLEEFIQEHPDTNLVIIDTLQKIRHNASDKNRYASDYRDVSELKQFADKHGIAVIVVQHLRKQESFDPHIMVSGSTGLTGSSDGSYVLKRMNEDKSCAELYVRGRDIEELTLKLKFDDDTKQWSFVSGDTSPMDKMKSDAAISSLIAYMKMEKCFDGAASELVGKANIPIAANVLTRRMKKYERELSDIGITFEKHTTGDKRLLSIKYLGQAPHDT